MIEEVLPPTHSQNIELATLYGVRVSSKLCNKVLKESVDESLRINYPHLKRVKRSEKCTSQSSGQEKDEDLIVLLGETLDMQKDILKILGNNTEAFLVKVPKHEPLTREQYVEWNKVWPVSYRQPSWRPMYFFDKSAVQEVISNLIRRVSTNHYPLKECAGACILAQKGEIVSEVYLDNPFDDDHPLLQGHAPFIALQTLSRRILKLQAIETDESLLKQHPDKRNRIGRHISPFENDVNYSSIRNGQFSHKRSHEQLINFSSHTSPHVHSDSLFLPLTHDHTILTSAQYYAQGLVAAVSSEPCVMCSMALLHSRIQCVLIPKHRRNKQFGGLGGLYLLHTQIGLNHKFHVLLIDTNQN